ncbi:hypothetical protein [Telmatospirillum sp.]|uniref:hypothetical protein n=1 Tax=Telmatospirillum sp. TaxID=2079197 RepID=UPI002843CD0E|nr:hypothetical protein [Telmatospirillum sp.]MDR3436430.1 hypothetical protein [Telmatospirillum sp.]
MLNFTASTAVTIVAPFLVDSEYVVPDTGSVTYSVRDNTGTLITALTNRALTPATTATEIAVTIPASDNAVTLSTEIRSLIVSYTVNAQPYQFVSAYRLNPWLSIAVTPADVRSKLGLSSTELPDADVNFYDTYYVLDDKLSTLTATATVVVTMAASLASGTLNAKYANDALIYQAALDLFPSLRARLLHKEGQGTTSYERYSGFDFDGLHDQITDLLEDALTNMTGMTSTYPSMLVVGKRRDIIGGPWHARTQ